MHTNMTTFKPPQYSCLRICNVDNVNSLIESAFDQS